jgi:tripartite-type tricarboxylate transporter receptor subunit TctC
VARANPDGYTLLITTSSTHSAAPSLFKNLPYDPIGDFTAIARLGSFPSVLVVNPALPIKTVQDLVAYAKLKPGTLSYGYGNSTGIIVGETLRKRLGVDIVKVPYRSNPTAVTDLIAGHIQVMVPDFTNALRQIADQAMRPLAVLTKERSASLPDVPTLDETIMPDFDLLAWAGIFGPAKMSDEVVQKLASEIKVALANPDNQQKLNNAGIEPLYYGPEEFKQYVAVELAKWTKVIKDAEIEPE